MQNQECPSKEKNIVLIGFMGVGKTTIGKLLAERLSCTFTDTDAEIEKKYGMKITEIFQQWGESEFRKLELEMITKVCQSGGNVVSLGGGAFLQEKVRNFCLKNGIVYFLDLSWESWVDRINLIIADRPILQNKTLEEMKELFYKRQELYSFHHFKMNTDALKPEEVVEAMIYSLKGEWKLEEI